MKRLMTIIDYTLASIALVLFCAWLFGVYVVDSMRVPQ